MGVIGGARKLKVVAAPDKLRGSASAPDAARAIAEGVRRAMPDAEVVELPVADGGEGTAQTLVSVLGGEMVHAKARDALGCWIEADYGLLADGRAVVEMARASGLALLSPQVRRPLDASTDGTGDLILAAASRGVRSIIVGMGGSATTDGGTGMARALGVRFLDKDGSDLPPGGGALVRLDRIDASGLDIRVRGLSVTAASDVDDPLAGPEGTARTYAPQKGASPQDVEVLERAMERYAQVIERDLGISIGRMPGAGAAGGLGAGLVVFLGAKIEPGIDVVLTAAGFDEKAPGADLLITAEGRLDAQTAHGKATAGVAARARRLGIATVALAGDVHVEDDAQARRLSEAGIDAYFALPSGPITLEEAERQALVRLTAVAEQVTRLFLRSRARRQGVSDAARRSRGATGAREAAEG